MAAAVASAVPGRHRGVPALAVLLLTGGLGGALACRAEPAASPGEPGAAAAAPTQRLATGQPAVDPPDADVPEPQVRRLLLPPPANLFQNSSFATRGDALYLASDDQDLFWTFSLASGQLLHPGVFLPSPGLASNPVAFGPDLVVLSGWFPKPSILVVDTAAPTAPTLAGAITLPEGASNQGMVPLTVDGTVGFVGSFADDRLYSFDARARTLLDPDGLSLPGNPDRATLAGSATEPLVVMVDTAGGTLMVADVSQPRDLRLRGVVALPQPTHFSSANRPVTAVDGRTVFVVSQERRLFAIDAPTATVLDPDGVDFGSTGAGLSVALHEPPLAGPQVGHRRTAVVLTQQGAALVDASDPRQLRLMHEVDFGGPALLQGDAEAAFSPSGALVAIPLISPAMSLVAVDVTSGRQVGPAVVVGEQPNALVRLGDDRLGVLCSGNLDGVWLVDGLFAAAGGRTPPL